MVTFGTIALAHARIAESHPFRSMAPVFLFGFGFSLFAIISNGFGPDRRLETLGCLSVLFSVGVMYVADWADDFDRFINKGLTCVVAIAGISYLLLQIFFPAPPVFSGPLLEAGEPSPIPACGKPLPSSRDDIGMFFGSDEVVGTGGGPFNPATAGDCSIATITRNAEGLFVDAFGYDSNGSIAWRLNHNNFELMSGGVMTAEGQMFGLYIGLQRNDKSTLRLVDGDGRTRFEVRYLNRNSVRVSGIFGCRNRKPIFIGVNSHKVGRQPAKALCAIVSAPNQTGISYSGKGAAVVAP